MGTVHSHILSSNPYTLFGARFAKFAFIVYLHDIVYKEKRLHK
jgi:hypothetical protein